MSGDESGRPSLSAEIARQGEGGGLTFRSWVAALSWLGLLALFAGGLGFLQGGLDFVFYFAALAYVLQGALADFLGIRISREGISFPNRVFPGFPLLVFWRRTVDADALERIDRLGNSSIAVFYSGEISVLSFATSDQKMRFLAYCRQIFPHKQIPQ